MAFAVDRSSKYAFPLIIVALVSGLFIVFRSNPDPTMLISCTAFVACIAAATHITIRNEDIIRFWFAVSIIVGMVPIVISQNAVTLIISLIVFGAIIGFVNTIKAASISSDRALRQDIGAANKVKQGISAITGDFRVSQGEIV
jgi:hypothetical protein